MNRLELNAHKLVKSKLTRIKRIQPDDDGYQHSMRARDNAIDLFEAKYPNSDRMIGDIVLGLRAKTIISIVATLHDVEEDTNMTLDEVMLSLVEGLELTVEEVILLDEVEDALALLNKKKHANYFEYVKAVKENFYARISKMGDLNDNISDLKEGSLKDKYRFALAYLEDE